MEKDAAQQTGTRGSPAFRGAHERQQRSAPGEVGVTRDFKRKSAHSGRTKRTKLPESERVYNLRRGKETSGPLSSPGKEFEAKYQQQRLLGEGGCGRVYAGCRRADHVPVAIKHVPKDKVLCKHVDAAGRQLSIEVAVMLRLQEEPSGPAGGAAAPVALLDWYDLDQELVLVQERPVPAVDLFEHVIGNGGSLPEREAKIILRQLVEAALHLQDNDVFHRDIKVENILIETGWDVPRVRLIDFGVSCFAQKESSYRYFYGTVSHAPPEWSSRSQYSAGPTTAWQMGVVLFETVHRQEDFDTAEFTRKSLTISKALSESCQDFLRVCLTEDPKKRATLKRLRRHPWLK